MCLKNSHLLAIAIVSMGLPSAVHAQTVGLRIIGTIVPAACQLSITNNGVFDYGNISAAVLRPVEYTVLDSKENSLSIVCDAPTHVALRVVDNRSASQVPGILNIRENDSDSINFGLGTSTGRNIGGYAIKLGSYVGDGVLAYLNSSNDEGGSWALSKGYLSHTRSIVGVSRTKNSIPGSYINITTTISVQAVLNKASQLYLRDKVALDGSATIELIYL